MERADTFQTQAFMKGNLKMENLMEKGLLHILIIENMLEIGKMESLKEEDFLLGLMETNMMASMLTVSNMEEECFIFRMGRYSRGHGIKVKSMGMVSFKLRVK